MGKVGDQHVSVQPGTAGKSGGFMNWEYHSGPNFSMGRTVCITYPIAAKSGPAAVAADVSGTKSLGKQWLCVLTKEQPGWNTNVGNSYVEVTQDDDGEWTYSVHRKHDMMGSVACLSKP